MTIQARIILGLICCVLSFLAGWHVHSWKVGAELTAEKEALLQERMALEKTVATIADKTHITISTDRNTMNEIQKKVEVQIAQDPISYGCAIPANGLQLYRSALASGSSTR